MKVTILNIHDTFLNFPSSQFWVIIFGLFFLALVLAGAIGTLGFLIGFVITFYAGYAAFYRIFDGRLDNLDD